MSMRVSSRVLLGQRRVQGRRVVVLDPSIVFGGCFHFSDLLVEQLLETCVEIKISRRVHAIDATPARWRGDAGSSPLEHPTHWLISTQVPALLPRLAGPLRAALADPDADVCGFALTVLAPLAELCGAALEQFLDRLLPPVARRCGGRGKLAAAALDALRRVEESCPGAGAKIRRKVPAYR